MAILSLVTRAGYESGEWVNHAVLYTPSSTAARRAENMCLADGIKGEPRGSDVEVGEGKKKTAFSRQEGARQYRWLCPKAHAFSSAPGWSRRIALTATIGSFTPHSMVEAHASARKVH